MMSNAITSYDNGHDAYNNDSSTEDDFSREVNRTRASYMAFNHAFSKVDALVANAADGYDDSDQYDLSRREYREEMVRDLIERKATVCKDAVVFASVMQFRRQLIEEEMQFQSANAMQTALLSQRIFDFQHRLDVKRMHSVLLKGGLLGLSNIMRSFLPQEADAFQDLRVEKHVHNVTFKGELSDSDLSKIIREHLSQEADAFEHRQDEKKMCGMLLNDDSNNSDDEDRENNSAKENFYKNKSHEENVICNTSDLSKSPNFLSELQNQVSQRVKHVNSDSNTDCASWSHRDYVIDDHSDSHIEDETDGNDSSDSESYEKGPQMDDNESVSMESVTVQSITTESVTMEGVTMQSVTMESVTMGGVEIYSDRKMQQQTNVIENNIDNETNIGIVSDSDEESYGDVSGYYNHDEDATADESPESILRSLNQNADQNCDRSYIENNNMDDEDDSSSSYKYYSESDEDSSSSYDMDYDESSSSCDNNDQEDRDIHNFSLESEMIRAAASEDTINRIKPFNSKMRGATASSTKIIKNQPYHRNNSSHQYHKRFTNFDADTSKITPAPPSLVRKQSTSKKRQELRKQSTSKKRQELESQWIRSAKESNDTDSLYKFNKNRKKFTIKSESITARSSKNTTSNNSAFKSKIISASSWQDGERTTFKSGLIATSTTKLLRNQQSGFNKNIKNSTYLRQNKFIQFDVTCKRKARQRQFELKWTETTSSSYITYKSKPDNRKPMTTKKMQQMESKWRSSFSSVKEVE